MAKQPKPSPYHGFVVIDKPLHMTSADVVARARRILGMKKIGHAGTLDPLASGVLPLALGEGTKCIHLLMDAKKIYRFRIRFGEARTTEDAEGDVTHKSAIRPDSESIKNILPQFIGDIMQRPPIYSALKIAGRRAYDMARAGEAVELPARPVKIDALTLESMPSADEAELMACVGKGTYIRSLARDIAETLGTYGYISYLRREAVGAFSSTQAISLDFLEEAVHNAPALGGTPWLRPLISLLDGIPAYEVSASDVTALRRGQKLRTALPPIAMLAMTYQGSLIAFGTSDGVSIQPNRVLNITPDAA